MLEFYIAYADVNQMMDFAEELLRSVVYVALGHTHVRYGEHEIDFSQPFQRITMKQAIVDYWPDVFREGSWGRVDSRWVEEPELLRRLVAAAAGVIAYDMHLRLLPVGGWDGVEQLSGGALTKAIPGYVVSVNQALNGELAKLAK